MISIDAIEYSLPEGTLTNAELRDAYPDWDFNRLEERTGVLSRHIAGDGETSLDFALRACEKLITRGQLDPGEVDAVIFCTQTPDYVMPPNSCLLHGQLGLRPDVLAFDINLACSGYVYGLQLASSLIGSSAARVVLLVTADTYSRYIHPRDRATRCLFGDGGAVTILRQSANGRGLRDIRCGTAGKHHEKFMIRAGGMRVPSSEETAEETVDRSGNVRTAEHITMDGMGVLSFFNATVPCSVRQMLEKHQLSIADIDLFVFHQASRIALDSIASALRIPAERMVRDLADTGNLVSASIPVALARALESGRARAGQTVLLCGFGVGLSWGTALVDL